MHKLIGLSPLIILVYGSLAPADELRIWTDSTGTHKTEAEFLRIDGESVVLRKDGGGDLTVPLDRLSDADREIAQTLEQTRLARLEIENTSRRFLHLLRQTNRDEAEALITTKARGLWETEQSPIKNIPNVDRGSRPRVRGVEVSDETAQVEAALRYKGKTYPAVLHLRQEEGQWLIYAATGQNEEGEELHYDFEGDRDSSSPDGGFAGEGPSGPPTTPPVSPAGETPTQPPVAGVPGQILQPVGMIGVNPLPVPSIIPPAAGGEVQPPVNGVGRENTGTETVGTETGF